MMDFTASDVLLKAASRIEEDGMWCRGVYFAGDDQSLQGRPLGIAEEAVWLAGRSLRVAECAMGAIASSVVALFGEFRADSFLEAVDLVGAAVGTSVPGFNDHDAKSAHEVAEAMRRAAS